MSEAAARTRRTPLVTTASAKVELAAAVASYLEATGEGKAPSQPDLLERRLAVMRATSLVEEALDRGGRTPEALELQSRVVRQTDCEAHWFAQRRREMHDAPLFHRSAWGYAYIAEAFAQAGVLQAGRNVIGFGVGRDPLTSYLAAKRVLTVATDLSPFDMNRLGWRSGPAPLSELRDLHRHEVLSFADLCAYAGRRTVDMTALSLEAETYDGLWSADAVQHLGSTTAGVQFIQAAMQCLRPGGVAVHVFDFAMGDASADRPSPATRFGRSEVEALADALGAAGHVVAPLSFNPGPDPLDGFFDQPPFDAAEIAGLTDSDQAVWQHGHLRLLVGGEHFTSFALVVRKAQKA